MRSIICSSCVALLAVSLSACGGDEGTSLSHGGQSGAGGSAGTTTGGSAGTSTGGTATGGSATGGTSSGGSGTISCSATPGAAPAAAWANATGNLANMASECGNLGLVMAQPCSNKVIAGVAKLGLWATVDGGVTWTKLGAGAGSAMITNRISNIIFDPQDPAIFWEAGIYNGGGVYKTTNSGETFTQLGTVSHNDSLSVDLTDPERKTMIAGPHETTSKLFRSTDSGANWTDVGGGLPGGAGFCTATQVINATTFLAGCNNGGVYRSTDGGTSWAQASSKGVVPQPLMTSTGTIYWPANNGGMEKSTDQGASFTSSADSNTAPGIVAPAQVTELPDGRIVIIGKDHLLITADAGATWQPIGDPMPYPGGGYDGARGVTYSAMTKTFYIWRWDCGNPVPANAIMSSGFDYQTQ